MALEPSVQTLAAVQPREEWQQPTSAAKRCVDFVGAIMVLVFLSPALILIAIAIKLDSPGPILFYQDRFGKDQKIIRVYKFRTMQALNDVGMRQTAKNDPRVTRVGRLLRMHSIDEVPQLLNVIIGNMSLVGPRPMPLGIRVEGLTLSAINKWNMRYAVKPGLTGLAQVNGSRGALLVLEDVYARLHYDLEYIADWSLLWDLKIILRTVRLCIRDRNAC